MTNNVNMLILNFDLCAILIELLRGMSNVHPSILF